MAGKFSLADHIQKAQPPQVRDIEAITGEILDAKQRAGEAILTIGRGLMEAKALLSHGEWLPWLINRVEFSEDSAENYMKLARKYSNSETLRNLGYSKALALLSLPDKTRDEFIEIPHVVNGEEKTVVDMSVRELKAAIKERDEALKAAEQAKADQSAAEQAREKMAADMKAANARVSSLNDMVERYSAEARERQETLAKLTAELETLRSRPVDVAVEADPAAIEAARKETEKWMKGELKDAWKAYNDAKAELLEANNSLQQAKLERKQVEAELRNQLAQAEKKAALTSSEDLVLFRALFDQTQELANKMGGVLLKVRNKDPEKAEGLSKAMLALSEKIQEVAQQ